MMGGKGGVLTPEQAKQLMAVLQEMTEYVDGEDLEGIAAQKPIYELSDMGGAVQTGAPGLLEEEAEMPEPVPLVAEEDGEDDEEMLLKKAKRS